MVISTRACLSAPLATTPNPHTLVQDSVPRRTAYWPHRKSTQGIQRLSTETAKIGPGKQVTLHIAVYLDDGTEVLSSFGDEPMRCRIGDGTLAPGLEGLLVDLEPGADEQMIADGAALFGASDAALVHRIPHSDLPEGFTPEPGQVIQFQAPGGQETTGTVMSANDTEVEIDFNHPLTNRGLRIHAQVLEVS